MNGKPHRPVRPRSPTVLESWLGGPACPTPQGRLRQSGPCSLPLFSRTPGGWHDLC